MKSDTPCIIGYQSEEIIKNCQKCPMDIFGDEAGDKNTPLFCAEKEWHVKKNETGFTFRFKDEENTYPLPNLIGNHQIQNAGLALAALQVLKHQFPLSYEDISYGLTHAHWPGRLERIQSGKAFETIPNDTELWYDGGHNDSAGEAIARQIKVWNEQCQKDTHLILGMKADKKPDEFLKDILPQIQSITVTKVNDIGPCITAGQVEPILKDHDIHFHGQNDDLVSAAANIIQNSNPEKQHRIMICGSLYLAEKL